MAPKAQGISAKKRGRLPGAATDVNCQYATDLDAKLEQWRALAVEWLRTLKIGKSIAMAAIKRFLIDYVHDHQLETNPAVFLRVGYKVPCFYDSCLSHLATQNQISNEFRYVSKFIEYVLTHYYSVADDNGNRTVPPEFVNPIPDRPHASLERKRWTLQQSDKNVLPYTFIGELRSIVCPEHAESFFDWTWAQKAGDSDLHAGSGWFVVAPDVIDENDPNCVSRKRAATLYEQDKYGYGDELYEMWSPVPAVALYLKLQLPLRTYQVRMLDSGEADTWRFKNGHWMHNTGHLTQGTEKNPLRHGVFRRFIVSHANETMTGLFINTNKTADKDKDEWTKGYELPWQHEKALYWLEKLRDWQEKYNPITAPMPWTSLSYMHTGKKVKAQSMLKAMGSTCFLFRDARATGDDRFKPIVDYHLNVIWRKLLGELQNRCEARAEKMPGGRKMEFVKSGEGLKTHFPLHSLRVSLITAYALDGGVPMPILSKCIAGHARLIMTLYYTKIGITYVTEKMQEAEKRLIENEQAGMMRWLKDATYKQLEVNGAFSDPAAIQAVLHAQTSGASLVKDDKGICPKGGWACDSGGVFVNDDTSKISYGEVPGYPQKNCTRCRWFFSGPAFLPGLVDHFNFIGTQMGDAGERIAKLEGQIILFEDQQYECQMNDRPFLEQERLNTLRKVHQADVQKNDKLANDYNATLRLITRCQAIIKAPTSDNGVNLVAVGNVTDVQISINECSRLQQVLTVVAGSTVFPENDVGKAVLQASQAIDVMLAMNGKSPICFRLPEDEQIRVVQEATRLLQAETGSIKNALPFIEGSRKLAEIGLDHNISQMIQEVIGLNLQPRIKKQHGNVIRIHQLQNTKNAGQDHYK